MYYAQGLPYQFIEFSYEQYQLGGNQLGGNQLGSDPHSESTYRLVRNAHSGF